MTTKANRKTFFVDRTVQGMLLVKATGYWLLSLFVVGAMTFLGWVFVTPGLDALVEIRAHLPSLIAMLVMALLSTLIVLPVILIDLVRQTNRFAGPIHRLQRVMQEAVAGTPVEPIHFRDHDYWQELATTFNQLIEQRETPSRPDGESEILEFETIDSGRFVPTGV